MSTQEGACGARAKLVFAIIDEEAGGAAVAAAARTPNPRGFRGLPSPVAPCEKDPWTQKPLSEPLLKPARASLHLRTQVAPGSLALARALLATHPSQSEGSVGGHCFHQWPQRQGRGAESSSPIEPTQTSHKKTQPNVFSGRGEVAHCLCNRHSPGSKEVDSHPFEVCCCRPKLAGECLVFLLIRDN